MSEAAEGKPKPERWRFRPLLVALVLLSPALEGTALAGGVALLVTGLLVSAVYAVHQGLGVRVGVTLLVPALLLLGAHELALYPGLLRWATLSQGLLLAWATGCVLTLVLADGEVDGDRLAGAVAVYLLLGVIAGRVFHVLELTIPGSFAYQGAPLPPETLQSSLNYFSLVTLSSLGYGDITPTTHMARNLAALEAVLGQIYLAILVGRLVGLQLAQSGSGGEATRPRD